MTQFYLTGYVLAIAYMIYLDLRVGTYFKRKGLKGVRQWAVVDYVVLPPLWCIWPMIGCPNLNH